MKKILLLFLTIFIIGCEHVSIEKIDSNNSIIIGDSIVNGTTWEIDSYGKGGFNIQRMISDIPDLSDYNNVFILLGINNLSQKDSPEEIKIHMDDLIKELEDKNIYIISVLPIDSSIVNFTTNVKIEAVNKLYSTNYQYINIYSESIIDGNNPYTKDGVHPNDEGYEIIKSVLHNYIDF